MRHKRAAERDEAIDRAYGRLVGKLERVVNTLETMGEEDIGLLHESLARDFHSGTAKLRGLLTRLRGDG